MNKEVKLIIDEGASLGRCKAMLEAIAAALGKGAKRSASERRALWEQIAEEATARRDGIAPGIKPRAKRQVNGTPTILDRQTATEVQ